MRSCLDGSTQVADLLIRHGADIDAYHVGRVTALHVAARLGIWKTVKYLIRKGAEVDLKTEREDTPLHYAVMALKYFAPTHDVRKVINVLLNAQADINPLNHDRKTPLDIASDDFDWFKPDQEIIAHMRKKGAQRACNLIRTKNKAS